jgi:signal transduction histidine kinase/CheY-like chemotaxis protein
VNTAPFKPTIVLLPANKSFLDQASLDELRAAVAPRIFVFSFVLGLAISIFTRDLSDLIAPRIITLLLMVTPIAAWAIQIRNYRLGIWTLTAGYFIAILMTQVTYPSSVVLISFSFLVLLTGLCISKWAGLATAVVSTVTLGLLASQILLPAGDGLLLISLLLIWGTLLLCWSAIDPLNTLIQWSWYYFTQANEHAETARDRQAELALALQDLTEANRQLQYLNKIVRAAQREAEEASRSKMEFAANVSHELRTPLNMIIGFSETLLEAPRIYQTSLPPAQMADIAAIHRNGCHLQSLIDDVLDLSQIDMHRMALSKERTTLPTLVNEAVEAVGYLYQSKSLGLIVDLPDNLPEILCDSTRIREVLLNLLSNAGRFTERGAVTIRAQVESAQIVVSVADSGPGIPPEQLKRLFEPFQQLDNTIRRRYGGSGLGLAISRAFVEMHGGKMWVESELGVGSTFYFSLPLPYQALAPTSGEELAGRYVELRARPLHAPTLQSRPHVAVVGDNQVLQRLLVRYLSEVEIIESASLDEAVAKFADSPFQAIIANAETVEQSVAYLAQQQKLPPHVPYILTGFSAASGGAQLLNVTDYLVKPITRQKLMAALQALPQPVQTILVADDDADMRQLVDRYLSLETGKRYRLLKATNGFETLHLLRTRCPDVLLLDLAMPDLDGYGVLKEKDVDPAIRDIPVLIISAHDLLDEALTSTAIIATTKSGIPVPKVLKAIVQLSEILGLSALAGDPMQREKEHA